MYIVLLGRADFGLLSPGSEDEHTSVGDGWVVTVPGHRTALSNRNMI